MKTLQSKNILKFTNIRIFFSASDAVSRSVIVMYVRAVGRFKNLEGGKHCVFEKGFTRTYPGNLDVTVK